MYNGLTIEQHATQARAIARRDGMHDCIHYAPNWRSRADTLYHEVNTFGLVPMSIGLLADGRMAVLAGLPFESISLGFAESV